VKIRGNTVGTPLRPKKAVVKATDLTDEEKAQARENIGAVGTTDYGSQTTAGLCKGFTACGTYVGAGGAICIQGATLDEIASKEQVYKPITPSALDYAVKKGLADSKEEWTEAEKAAARSLLGISSGGAAPHFVSEAPDATVAGAYIGEIVIVEYNGDNFGDGDAYIYCGQNAYTDEHIWSKISPTYSLSKAEIVDAVIAALPIYNGEVEVV
jgi:hypothetical protein